MLRPQCSPLLLHLGEGRLHAVSCFADALLQSGKAKTIWRRLVPNHSRIFDFVTQQLVDMSVELTRMPAAQSELAIRCLAPRLELYEAIRNLLVVGRSLDRVRNRGQKDIWFRFAHVVDRGLDIFHLFALVAP